MGVIIDFPGVTRRDDDMIYKEASARSLMVNARASLLSTASMINRAAMLAVPMSRSQVLREQALFIRNISDQIGEMLEEDQPF